MSERGALAAGAAGTADRRHYTADAMTAVDRPEATGVPPARPAAVAAFASQHALLLIVGLGALLRFATLGVQGFWLDEQVTVSLIQQGPIDLLKSVQAGESKPTGAASDAETAAWTMVANLILNLDETVTRN